MLLYSLALTLALLLASPWWLLRMATTQRYREGLAQRLGRVPAALRAHIAGKRVLWLHAVSVGETLAAQRLVSDLEAALGVGWCVVISTTTRTGYALACERFGADRVFYMPLDFAFSTRAYLRALQPAAVVLMESELWPRLLHEGQRRNIPRLVVNARVSDRSFRRALKVRALWKHVLAKVSLFLAQSEEDTSRLTQLGAPDVQTLGNLKFDIRTPKLSPLLDRIRAEATGRPIIVAGSLVEDRDASRMEDELVIAAWAANIATRHQALLILAPRHPQNFKRAEAFAAPFRYLRASDWARDPAPQYSLTSDGPLEILILDTIGDLASIYSLATMAFVGGSLVPRGGHNPLEPAHFGVPITMGNSFENFRTIMAHLVAANAIQLVNNENELEQAWLRLLDDPASAQAMGQRARAVFNEESGATARTVAAILHQVQP
ncbi:MAG: 3-deoxy-D-manno-octulosonic acid transferase [Acidobacteriaceae bacterium]|nr:3-deoxy-D-manno-octulosonic acid transferase [Acidobacteriaceae bacterium]